MIRRITPYSILKAAIGFRNGKSGAGCLSFGPPAFERAISDNDVTHTARKAVSLPQNAAAPELVRLRKAKPIDHVLPVCMKWLRSLLEHGGRRHWRTNTLESPTFWSKPAACRRDLDDLLIDHRRGNRRGFPLDMHRELEALRDYYESQHPGS